MLGVKIAEGKEQVSMVPAYPWSKDGLNAEIQLEALTSSARYRGLSAPRMHGLPGGDQPVYGRVCRQAPAHVELAELLEDRSSVREGSIPWRRSTAAS